MARLPAPRRRANEGALSLAYFMSPCAALAPHLTSGEYFVAFLAISQLGKQIPDRIVPAHPSHMVRPQLPCALLGSRDPNVHEVHRQSSLLFHKGFLVFLGHAEGAVLCHEDFPYALFFLELRMSSCLSLC